MKTVEELTAQADEAADEFICQVIKRDIGNLVVNDYVQLHTLFAMAYAKGRIDGVANLKEAQREATASLS